MKHTIETILALLRTEGAVPPSEEYYFALPEREWRFDFCWPEKMVAWEIEGLVGPCRKSRHTTNDGYSKDCEKYSEAAILGWKVIRTTQAQVADGLALHLLEKALGIVPLGQMLQHMNQQRSMAGHHKKGKLPAWRNQLAKRLKEKS